MTSKNSHVTLLADYKFTKSTFDGLDEVFASFKEHHILSMNAFQKSEIVGRQLVRLLKAHESKRFLMGEVLDYIHRVHEEKILEKYTIVDFELWMNQFSGLTAEENYYYRALIAGKWIPREDYQAFFPIGMGKVYTGSHFVTAHQSPDIDTIVASFWGWMDAFAARVASGLHVWNVPGGAPESCVEVGLLFHKLLHPQTFAYLSKNRSQLNLTSFDLMTQQGFVRKKRFEHSLHLDTDRTQSAVVLVDDEGYYMGDWRPFDVESIRQVIMLLNLCIRWLETTLHLALFTLFSKPDLSKQDILNFSKEIAGISLQDSEPLKEMTLRQQNLLGAFLQDVLGVASGLQATLQDILASIENLEILSSAVFWDHIQALADSKLFDKLGCLQENRPLMFQFLQKIVEDFQETFKALRQYIDTLNIGFQIKTKVFGHTPQYLSYRTDVSEIENQMGAYPYLTVNIPGPSDKQIPIGIIRAQDLKKPYLGTATLRDFCNRDETKVPPYLEVISVVDHHKSALATATAPTATIADAQSVNSIICQIAFGVHDEYSLGGMDEKSILEQIAQVSKKAASRADFRILRRLYKKQEILQKPQQFYIDPKREYLEYLHYLYAIMDDTDLLTKVSKKDVEAVKDLLNRLKTLAARCEMETVDFDDLDQDPQYVKKAAAKLLKNKDLYSLYSISSAEKEKTIAENFIKCSQGKTSDIFMDTKVQNGCCRVGQSKMFNQNYPLYKKLHYQIRDYWYQTAQAIFEKEKEIDLHLHMISTIASADEVHQGQLIKYDHQDEMWLWIPDTDLAAEHLKLFLNSFKASPALSAETISIECYGKRASEYQTLLKESFFKVEPKLCDVASDLSYAVIYYPAGSLNSRKAMVSPYLPKIGK